MVVKDIDLYPADLQFCVYSSEEIKKLSVVKIITGLTFNQLGRPLPGGLYDQLMGVSSNRFDVCGTCLGQNQCPGHFGHIELKVLLYNPFFIKLVYDIIRISCLKCYKLQLPDHVQRILKLQLDLIDAGYIIQAQEIDILKSPMVYQGEKTIKTEDGFNLHPKIAEMYELLQKPSKNLYNNTKTSSCIRTLIVNSALQVAVNQSKNKNCIHCKLPSKKVRYLYKKLVVNISKAERESIDLNPSIDSGSNQVILADQCRVYLREIFANASDILPKIYPILQNAAQNDTLESPVDIFFLNAIPVTPPNARPCNVVADQIVEHSQTKIYRQIIEANSLLRLINITIKTDDKLLKDDAKIIFDSAKGSTAIEKLYFAMQELQTAIDQLLDVAGSVERNTSQGLKQVLEKKEGLLRKHMMGKRVNFACRTVITPDPNINVEELGIPEIFAKKLSYPVPVTPWNRSALKKMVVNGPDVHPGANFLEDEKGFKMIIPPGDSVKRQSLANLLLTNPENGIKVVHRHLLNGDILLLNRQPTLHKPSIMAHKARVLPGEKTFRLHYSNCKAYNADFDGDEMNAHYPQGEVARAEAYNIVNVANQYLVPKDGTPLGGLIQDHVISGVKLSVRGRFFNKEDYYQLVYQGLAHKHGNIKLLPPTILKPFRLWSGKQILSTILLNIIPENYPAINLTSSAKVETKHWQTAPKHHWIHGGGPLYEKEMSESEVIIRKGELLAGVLDKQQYGATQYGLIHCVYELYGGECSTCLLTSFTKLFTVFLQREGFTLGVHDILVTSQADKKRQKIIKECREIGESVVAEALDLNEIPDSEILADKMQDAYIKNNKFRVILDRKFKSALDSYTNDINQVCLPSGLISQFPSNNLQLMVLSGAKGSMVNTMQISSLLGQIELEGKRPPLMISGKSLPSFAKFETSPKSGGFIDGRFMTGIQPQDFFFHCMAGREGLIDTAVKTSRSGYLQRCLIKHLEGLNVSYDLTVRDSDNSVVQFLYGEDGLDIAKSRFFNPKCMKFLDENAEAIVHANEIEMLKENDVYDKIKKHKKKIKSWLKKHDKTQRSSSFQKFSAELRNEIIVDNGKKLGKTGRLKLDAKIIKLWNKADIEKKQEYDKKYPKCPDPIISKYNPDNFYGAISEYLENIMMQYSDRHSDRKSHIRDIIYTKSLKSMAAPGEPVGLLAAQSIGEPSTQMTLNTFHFAGRGEMNVTLGIPRLREILMLASENIKTPSLDIPFKPKQIKKSEKLRIKLNRVTVEDVLQDINVNIRLILKPQREKQYTLHFTFLPQRAYEEDFCVTPKQILKYMQEIFFKLLFKAIDKSSKAKFSVIEITNFDKADAKEKSEDDFDEDNNNEKFSSKKGKPTEVEESSDDEDGDDDATGVRLKNKKIDENEYDDPEAEEEVHDADEDQDKDDEDVKSLLGDHEDKVKDENEDEMLDSFLAHNEMVKNYTFDQENFLWCKLTFNLKMKHQKLNISSVLKALAANSVIYQIPKIKRAITYKNNDDIVLKTDGINIVEMFKYNKILDLNRLYSNDIHAIANTYGIEAAARVIVKEVKNVFNVYGITVDPRHLLLIADYMTFEGKFKPLSRKGLEHSASPLQQMTFEATLSFLKTATITGRIDDLTSPSARIMVGLPVKNGTGSFSLLSKLSY